MKKQTADFEAALVKSGFSAKEIQYLHRNVPRYGRTVQDVVFELANRFRMVISVSVGAVVLFVAVILFGQPNQVVSAGVSLLLMLLVVWFFQPPVICFKAWRYRKHNKDAGP
ncbi:hypothetical protein [Vagococcus sp. WN89Y]|uniref:hypothetical protein n=1 Tax=Vagococcus sp. WN89Y TaxID=3457258 RepID=UPI003FCDDB3F